ncbi:hypothetical protein [Thermoactinospora rubra]|uniref:hypothetical protein n=1 Tax=Thermoactinospora rubra TaxID=1088767 RepID=UPI000A0F798B|nr:hypothetical protein [Thermoactinospora rubra]
MKTTTRLLPALALAMTITACGAGAPQGDGIASAGGGTADPTASPSASTSADPRDAALKFAQCMREHGIDMPDPDESGRFMFRGRQGDQAKMEEAQKACEKHLQGAMGEMGRNDPKAYDQMVKYAQCLRQHGIDIDDPQPGKGLQIKVRPGMESKMKAAEEACKEFAPGRKG